LLSRRTSESARKTPKPELRLASQLESSAHRRVAVLLDREAGDHRFELVVVSHTDRTLVATSSVFLRRCDDRLCVSLFPTRFEKSH
jgi:hypothetical protein